MINEGDLAEDLSGKVKFAKGIEIGQVFELGQGYSKSMNITYLDANGKSQPFYMGCYGIGVSRLLSAIIEQHNDEYGIKWPKEVAPYQVHLICVDIKKEEQEILSEKIYQELKSEKVEILYDNRNERAGVKFNDADLIGIPLQIIVGKKAKENIVELKYRGTGEKIEIKTEEIADLIKKFYK